jgi:hypothetical protein
MSKIKAKKKKSFIVLWLNYLFYKEFPQYLLRIQVMLEDIYIYYAPRRVKSKASICHDGLFDVYEGAQTYMGAD